MAAFADYLDLRTAVIELVKRPDITDVFDRLTQLAESYLNRELRVRKQVTNLAVTVSNGSAGLPSSFREMIGLYDLNGYELVQQPLQGQRPIGVGYYALENYLLFAPDGEYTAQYYAKLPTITDSMTDKNWVLTEYPEVYLYAVAVEAAKHVRDAELLPVVTGYRDEAIAGLRADDNRARYSRARVRVQGCTP